MSTPATATLQSYLAGRWQGHTRAQALKSAINGRSVASTHAETADFAEALHHARTVGLPALLKLDFQQRAATLKALAKFLNEHKELLYAWSAHTGATRSDGWVDIEGGSGTLFAYAGFGSNELPSGNLVHEGPVLPGLKHGGPGRAGGGEELGGLRAVKHYLQRTAVQGSPRMLAAITGEHVRGAPVMESERHPFRYCFEDLPVGISLLTHRRTVGEADIVAFGGISGDYFYMHFDEVAAAQSPFGKRIAHGYFVLSAAAGLFVSPAPGPVLANYGLDMLRFVKPVGIGDTIQARLTCKRKTDRQRTGADGLGQGVVAWNVEVTNQLGELVANYDILTLVAKRPQVIDGAAPAAGSRAAPPAAA